MSVDPRSPVLVGVAAVSQREDDPSVSAEPLELMARALEAAAADADAPGLLRRLDAVSVPRGFWDYGDPGRLLAERFGAGRVYTTVAEVGVLQTTLLAEAAQRIAAGEADVVAVTGAEAKHRSQRARILGVEEQRTAQPDARADRVLRPGSEIYTGLEMQLGLLMPVHQYAVVENALRHEQGLSVDAHRREIAELWARLGRIAADNPQAWSRQPVPADEIREPGEGNRMLAFPYTRLHTSQWTVDQGAGLLLCSAAAADALGVAEERRVHPRAITESNHMLPLSRRAEIGRCAGVRIAGSRALEISGAKQAEVAHVELYSCFPAAVRLQARELGMPLERPLSVTGGMAFAGGPLNNFVLQGIERIAERLRADRGSLGLVTALSGIFTKSGFTTWSTDPGEGARVEDLSDAVEAATRTIDLEPDATGEAIVAGYTVLFEASGPRLVVLCDTDDGTRALAASTDPGLVATAMEQELVGRRVRVDRQQLEAATAGTEER